MVNRYEVASTGDGMGPETVTYWKLPPKAQMMQAQKADGATDQALAGQQALAGNPAPPNTFQDPTVWNGDHVLNGGNKEWAEEDGALHAYNMQRWRNKIIGEQIDRQRSQWDLMNEADWCDCNCGARENSGWDFKGARGQCGHARENSCGCSGQAGCGCTNSRTSSDSHNWDDGHSPGNSAHSHSTASQTTDYGYHSTNSEAGRGVHVSVTGSGHSVTVNGHSASDFGGGNVNSDHRHRGHDDNGYDGGYQCHSCQQGDSYGYHGRYHHGHREYDRRGSRSDRNEESAVLVDGEVPRELLDREVSLSLGALQCANASIYSPLVSAASIYLRLTKSKWGALEEGTIMLRRPISLGVTPVCNSDRSAVSRIFPHLFPSLFR